MDCQPPQPQAGKAVLKRSLGDLSNVETSSAKPPQCSARLRGGKTGGIKARDIWSKHVAELSDLRLDVEDTPARRAASLACLDEMVASTACHESRRGCQNHNKEIDFSEPMGGW